MIPFFPVRLNLFASSKARPGLCHYRQQSGQKVEVKWIFQAHPNDKGQIEADIGDSPQVYRLSSGQKVVGAGQKKTGI